MSYLTVEERRLLAGKLVELLGYDAQMRSVLLDGIPVAVRGLLSWAPQPIVSAKLDVAALADIDRLDDGSVPLKVFLSNATALLIGRPDADVVRTMLHQVETKSTGAPVIDPSGLPELQEAIVHRDDMVPFSFMSAGVEAAAAVAKLLVKRHSAGAVQNDAAGKPIIFLGSGWLVAPNLLMTNHHVVNAREAGEAGASPLDFEMQAKNLTALFDYNFENAQGTAVAATELVAWNRALDYALVRLNGDGRSGLQFGAPVSLPETPDDRPALNIIQHPDGHPKRYAIRNNLLTQATPTELRYFTDTMGGSSGSPILNDGWKAVGIHRGAVPVRNVNFNGKSVAYVNMGTTVEAILADLRSRYAGKVAELNI